jgi:hypothetical protein
MRLNVPQFDMRAAERAKERLQGTELAGRPVCTAQQLKSFSTYHAVLDRCSLQFTQG